MAKKEEKIEEQIEMTPNEEVIEDAPEVTVTETSTTVAPSSTRSREWMKNKFADEVWEDDAQYDDFLAGHLENTDKRLASYAESDARVMRILEANPDFYKVLDAMDKGMPFRVALRRYLGDFLNDEPVEGDDDFEAYQEATEKFLAEKKKADEEVATRTANLEKSDILFKEFVERNFPTEEEQVDFVEFVRASLRNIGMGDISEHFLDMMLKAYLHDKDVEDAKEAGAIEARNEKIATKRIKAAEQTDGLPMGGGSSPIVEEEMPEEDDFLGAAARRYRNREFK